VGVIIGSGIGGMWTIENQHKVLLERGPRKVSPFMIPALISNMCGGLVAIELGARGPNFGVVSACSTATHAIGESLRMIRGGEADVMVCGGAEAAITPLAYAGFCSMKAMSTNNENPQKSSRPFDLNRDGFIMGEGGAILVIESLEHALARGAHIYCELAGYAATCDAYHITSPDPEGKGLAQSMIKAMRDANIEPHQVDYINAHGTSTPYNDKFETIAIKKIFGDHARKVNISSTKSMTGHLLGAAGSIEAIISVKAIETGIVPPTINYETPDPDCDLDYTPNVKREAKINVVLTDNLGFGGHNAALIFKRH
jgi:3-oxoacyl-[acyl-carrier-protein] synthase II